MEQLYLQSPKKATILKQLLLSFLFITLLGCEQHKTKNKTAKMATDFAVAFSPLSQEYVDQQNQYLRSFYQQKYASNDFSGAFLVAKNGVILFENYAGYAYKEKDILIDAATPLHIASVSKMITAAALMRLVDVQKIQLDEKVQNLLPSFPYATISIKMLLNHRSGLRNYAYFTQEKGVWDSKETLTNQAVLDLLGTKNIQLEFTPDSRFAYCNTNYAILALIIEKVTQKPFPEAIKQLVFNPLKMNDTFVFDDLNEKENVSQSYKSGYRRLAFEYLDVVYGDKNVYTTAQDLLRFEMGFYSDSFLSKNAKKQMFRGYSYERKGMKNYGLGVRMLEFETGQKYFFHNGWWHGNTASLVTLQKDTVCIIAISNQFTRKTYQTKKLAPRFGDYPFVFKEEETDL